MRVYGGTESSCAAVEAAEITTARTEFGWGLELLDRARERVLDGDLGGGMDEFRSDILDYRTAVGPELWGQFARELFPRHPLRSLAHQSPLSRRSFERPRGYAGDAVTLDYIYGYLPPGDTTRLGQKMFRWEMDSESARSVRDRREVLAQYIDETAARAPQARILSVACGHLRELLLSTAFRDGALAEFIGLDQDPESIHVVQRDFGHRDVAPICAGVRALMGRRPVFQNMDLVYTAGLYDYLENSFATRLTSRMFSMLRSGGQLLIANVHPRLRDIAAMETVMNWWLIYRDENQLAALAAEIDPVDIASLRLFPDKHENVVFLEVTRK